MEYLFDLDNRLSLCASFVRKGARVADIGTDHAYLPVWLCKNGKAKSAIAADINPEPLKRGEYTIAKYGAKNLVTSCLSDGLAQIAPNTVDDIIIAGMGGELIAQILNNAPWVKNEKYHFILQPMTKAEVLREYLYSNGFNIESEQATMAENKLYSVMSVYFTGKVPNDFRLKMYYGGLTPGNSEYAVQYIKKTANALLKKGKGMLTADSFSNQAKKYIHYGEKLMEYAKTGVEPQNITTVQDIYSYIDSFAPFNTALDYDNVGILAGDKNAVVSKVMVALDITSDVVNEAYRTGASLIVSHHPVIFKPVRSLASSSIPYMLAQRGLSAVCAHTNLDLSPQGVNVCMANVLELENVYLHSEGIAVGDINGTPMSSKQFAFMVKEKLNCTGVRFTDITNKISRVAVGGGACGEYIYLAKELGADAFVTGEIKHNYILEAHDINLTVVDAGHYRTEDVVIDYLVQVLGRRFPNVEFIKSKTFTDYISYL